MQNCELDDAPDCETPDSEDRKGRRASIAKKLHDGAENTSSVRLLTLGLTSFICVASNLLVPSLLWNGRYFGSLTDSIAFFATGSLVAQLFTCATWLAGGPQTLKTRILTSLLSALLICCSFIVGLQIPEFPSPSMPNSVAIVILGVGMGGVVLTNFLIKALMWATNDKIVDGISNSCGAPESFSILNMIVFTSLCAIALTFVRAILPDNQDPLGRNNIFPILVIAIQYAVYSSLLVASCVHWVMRDENRLLSGLGLAFLLLVAAPANLYLLTFYKHFRVDSETILWFSCFTMGLITAFCCLLFLLRITGYSLGKAS